jgi:hypothetical protein
MKTTASYTSAPTADGGALIHSE